LLFDRRSSGWKLELFRWLSLAAVAGSALWQSGLDVIWVTVLAIAVASVTWVGYLARS
jgi:hypothetical protein